MIKISEIIYKSHFKIISEPIQYEERLIFSIYAFNNRTLTMSKQNLIEKIRNKQLEKGYKMFLIIARINSTENL